jgi:hypothetical protein
MIVLVIEFKACRKHIILIIESINTVQAYNTGRTINFFPVVANGVTKTLKFHNQSPSRTMPQ